MGTEPGAVPPNWLQVWVEAGRDGQVFTYANPRGLALAVGDLVQVHLRGRRQSGLVVAVLSTAPADLNPASLRPIEQLLQTAAVTPQWQALIEQVACSCHTSTFQTLKSALPSAWLGQRRSNPSGRPGRSGRSKAPSWTWPPSG